MIGDLTFDDFKPAGFAAVRQAMEAKTPLPGSAFAGLEADAKTAAFSIARVEAMKDIMAARKVIAQAIDGKVTFREAMLVLQDKLSSGDFSRQSLARLQLIIHQNIAQAQAVARTEALKHPTVAEAYPFWQYMTVGDGTPLKFGVRASHAALHGLVFRHDDPFWDAHKPPWEYRCRCYWIPLRQADVDRMGIAVRGVDFVRGLGVEANPDFGVPGGLDDLPGLAKRALDRLDDDLRAKLEQMERGREPES